MNSQNPRLAPGSPGITPRWTSSRKSGVGTALDSRSALWFTLSHGIVNEVYFPWIDQACTRDFGLVVTDGQAFFSEEKRHARSVSTPLVTGVPAYRLVNTCREGRYRIEKEIVSDPRRSVLLQRIRFTPTTGVLDEYLLFALVSPHLANHGWGNTGWIDDYKGRPMLFAQRDSLALAVASSAPWLARSAGFVGVSDGWQDLEQHRRMTWQYDRAEDGNVALCGQIDLASCGGEFILALALGRSGSDAGYRARCSLLDGFDCALDEYARPWQQWQTTLLPLANTDADRERFFATSTAVLRTHEAKQFPGASIASLSIPWGFMHSDLDLGGYHLVWPRDLVETAGGLLAAGAVEEARLAIPYLRTTQEADGHWAQNAWLDGQPYWNGIQMDETALPILLLGLTLREGAFLPDQARAFWPMVRRAAAYLAVNGPVTQQDRWEESPGYSPFTLAAEIAALLCAASRADENGEPELAGYLRETADAWNASIERWIYVTGTELARQVGVEGYYVRLAPPPPSYEPIQGAPSGETSRCEQIVSPDALALVRFGLREANDPRIVQTVKVIDALLLEKLPQGPVWRRYNGDAYGEHADGSPFDGSGLGRAWPLLVGERAHYELAAGRLDQAAWLRRVMEDCAADGLIPEQVWNAPDIPDRELSFGRPTGSAMPLVWAHAEYIKLCRSIRERRVFDLPSETASRYLVHRTPSRHALWRFNQKVHAMPRGKLLRIETLAPAMVHWSLDDWHTTEDTSTRDTGLGIHLVDLPTQDLPPGNVVHFTFFWPRDSRWEGRNFSITVD